MITGTRRLCWWLDKKLSRKKRTCSSQKNLFNLQWLL